jgi:hypothetical protein
MDKYTIRILAWINVLVSRLHYRAELRIAAKEGLIANGTSIHAGLRTRLMGNAFYDYDIDEQLGFVYIETDGTPQCEAC